MTRTDAEWTMHSGRASIDQLEIVLTTESVKGVSKEHQNAVIDEVEKTYHLANVRFPPQSSSFRCPDACPTRLPHFNDKQTYQLGSALSRYHVREMSFAHYSRRLRQGDAALLEIWELLKWHHEGWEGKQKRCFMRHLTG